MDRVVTSATWVNSDLAWPGLRWALVRFTYIDDSYDCNHDDDHKNIDDNDCVRQSDENMLFMRDLSHLRDDQREWELRHKREIILAEVKNLGAGAAMLTHPAKKKHMFQKV